MSKSGYFFRRVRNLIALVAALIFFLSVLLPPVLGVITRAMVVSHVNALQSGQLERLGISSLQAETRRPGWFSSEVQISASGRLLSADGTGNAVRTGVVAIHHGPVLWHLADSALALADLQLIPAEPATDPAQHFSGAAIAKLTPSLHVNLNAIAGIHASGGEHWLELQLLIPIVPFQRNKGDLWFDLDLQALDSAGLGALATQWQQNATARVSNSRLLFNIGLQ